MENELKRYIKRVLKGKVSVNNKTIMTYLFAGFIGLISLFSSVLYARDVNMGGGRK